MSDTQCKDCCIVSIPAYPQSGLQYQISVNQGQNLVLKSLGTSLGYYPADMITSTGIPMAPGSTWVSGASASSVLIITDQPLQVTLASESITQTLNVNQLLLVDDVYDSVTIQNPSTATETANVSVFYTQQ